MKIARITSNKQVHGEVEWNDGQCAEIQTFGVDGIECRYPSPKRGGREGSLENSQPCRKGILARGRMPPRRIGP
jgi:hypothetical protein